MRWVGVRGAGGRPLLVGPDCAVRGNGPLLRVVSNAPGAASRRPRRAHPPPRANRPQPRSSGPTAPRAVDSPTPLLPEPEVKRPAPAEGSAPGPRWGSAPGPPPGFRPWTPAGVPPPIPLGLGPWTWPGFRPTPLRESAPGPRLGFRLWASAGVPPLDLAGVPPHAPAGVPPHTSRPAPPLHPRRGSAPGPSSSGGGGGWVERTRSGVGHRAGRSRGREVAGGASSPGPGLLGSGRGGGPRG